MFLLIFLPLSARNANCGQNYVKVGSKYCTIKKMPQPELRLWHFSFRYLLSLTENYHLLKRRPFHFSVFCLLVPLSYQYVTTMSLPVRGSE